MLSLIKEEIQSALGASLAPIFAGVEMPEVVLDVPADKKFGEFSCNIALKSARVLKKSPAQLAVQFQAAFEGTVQNGPLKEKISRIEVVNPGFINFYLTNSATYDILYQVFREADGYGRSDFGKKRRVQVEFVSANPTGPLSVAHARQAVVGDALVNIFNFIGFDAKREYYVNDEGNQINILGNSIYLRGLEIYGETVEFPENNYQGEYIRDMAQLFIDKNSIRSISEYKGRPAEEFRLFGVSYLMDVIRKELEDFRVHFDIWSYQSKIANSKAIEDVLGFLREKGVLYEKDGALWFRTTDFKDDKDRVVKKSDGAYTYFTPDIVYHRDKFRRGFEKIFNIWGPDHHGYIPRLTAAVEAMGQDREALEVLIVQLATLFRDGKPVSMSTRRGQYISLREVMDEVGVDAARFFFLMRHIKAHLEFDLELAKKETAENPVYYIQYAHARIHSIIDKAAESSLSPQRAGLRLLGEVEELDLIKTVGRFPDILVMCWNDRDAYSLVSYLQELATCFHKFYDRHRVVDPQNPDLSSERLAVIDAARIVLANGLHLLGISAPRKM